MKHLILMLALASASGLVLAQAPGSSSQPTPPPEGHSVQPATPAEIAQYLDQIQQPNTAIGAALSFRQSGDFANEAKAWARAVKLRPHLGRYKVELAAAYAQQDLKSEAYNALLELQTQGYAYELGKDPRFAKIATTEVWQYILKGLDSNRAPYGDATKVHSIPAKHELIESLAWDPTRKQLLVGSAREGKVFIVGKDGTLAPLASADDENGMWSVFDLAVDAKRGVLWVASTAVPHFSGYDPKADLGLAGVFKFDLKTGKFLKKFLSPAIVGQSFFLSTLTLGKDGEVYAADGVNNAVYQVRDDQFRRLFHAPTLSSIRGMAVSDDGKTLFLGDHERGLIGYDLAAGKPFDIGVPKTLTLGGIEGVTWYKGELIVVQNEMQPARVMRLKLSDDRRNIAAVQPLAANLPELTLPTLGTLAGDQFLFIANSQKPNYDGFGLVVDKGRQKPLHILGVDAGFKPKKPMPQTVPAQSR